MKNPLAIHGRIFFAMAFTALVARPALAIQTQEVDIGRSGVYDGVVKIERDGAGRMTLCDAEVTSPVTLSELRYSGTAHWLLEGLDRDDHPQYHDDARALTWLGGRSTSDLPEGNRLYYTDTRARSAVSAASPLTFDPATGIFGLSPASSPTLAGLSLTGIPSGAVPHATTGGALIGDTNRLSISSGGNVGIGTASPKTLLQVDGTAGINWQASADGALATARIGTSGSGGSFFVNTPSLGASYPSGLGIQGTYASGTKTSTINIGAYCVPYAGDGYSGVLAFLTSKEFSISEKMRIDGNGNVGIGTTAPGARLDVNGAARVRGALSIDGQTTVPAIDITGKMRLVGSAAQSLTTDTQTINCNAALVVLNPTTNRVLVSTPTISAGAEGQILTLINQSADCYVSLNDADMLAGTNLALASGTRTIYRRDVLTLIYSGGLWCEVNYASNH
ncbi:hypothetical protein LLG95_04175 [bacterium]|nr:hypothetical protein [bacterium]